MGEETNAVSSPIEPSFSLVMICAKAGPSVSTPAARTSRMPAAVS